MENSILKATKTKLSIPVDYKVFDQDIIDYINGVFGTLHQLGVGPEEPFEIEDDKATWDQFFAGHKGLNAVKTLVYLRVRMLFDPPGTSFTQEAMKNIAQEIEWRLNVVMEGLRSKALAEGSVFVWMIESREGFPSDAKVNDVGIDENGDVWRKTDG